MFYLLMFPYQEIQILEVLTEPLSVKYGQGGDLTLYQTIPNVDKPGEEAF